MSRLGRGFLVAALLGGTVGDLAVARAEEQVATNPGQPGGDPAPDAERAAQLITAQRYEEAITACKKSLSRDEHYVPAMMLMAKAYYYLKKYEFAGSIIDLAQKIEPNNAQAYNLLGFLSLVRDDRISATASFKKATELKADYGNAWNNLAAMLLYAKNYDDAVPAAEKATQLLPAFDKAWLNLGSAYRGKGRYDEAERAYRKALEYNSRFAAVYFNLGILYLDAPAMPNLDTTQKLQQANQHFARYKDFASLLPPVANDPVDAYVEEANKAIVLEGKRLEREKKKAERNKAKAAPADAPPPAPTPAPADGTPPAAPPAETPPAAPPPVVPPPVVAPPAAAPPAEPPPAPAPAPTGPVDEPGFGGNP